ncbi:MAG: ribonuclease Z [Desulfohalobiaceae bacterium]|nr:ribonuclease Z [Desulfohalobiaceae bacterium]
MEVTFLGVGEACDERYPNTSVLVRGAGRTLLLDCGFSVPGGFFKRVQGADDLDAIWISHFHGDHFFGLPQLLLRLFETGRKKPLYFIGQSGIEDLVFQVMDLAYPSFSRKFGFELKFLIVDPGQEQRALGFKWQAAGTRHSQENLALGLDLDGCRLYYSGDGRPTSRNVEPAKGCELMIHEGFLLEGQIHGHGSVQGCLDFAREAGAKRLAIVHVQRDVRRREEERLKRLLESVSYCRAFLPVPGDVFTI